MHSVRMAFVRSAAGGHQGIGYIEVLACLAVTAMLVTMAAPGLRSAWLRVRRAEAVGALTRLQLDQERFHLERGRYAADLAELQGAVGAAAPLENFALRVASAAPDEYLAEARALAAQSADRADCLRLAVDQRGERSPPAASGCWR